MLQMYHVLHIILLILELEEHGGSHDLFSVMYVADSLGFFTMKMRASFAMV